MDADFKARTNQSRVAGNKFPRLYEEILRTVPFFTVHGLTRASSWTFYECRPWRYFDYANIIADPRELDAKTKIWLTGKDDMRGNTVYRLFHFGRYRYVNRKQSQMPR